LPAARQPFAHVALVFAAKRGDRLRQPLEDIVVRIFAVVVDQRNRGVVTVIGREAQHTLAQAVIAPKRFRAGLRRLDEVFDDGGRDVVAVQGRFERRAIAARLRMEPVALQHAVVERRVGVDVGREQLMVGVEHGRAIGLVPVGRQDGAVLPVGQRDVGTGRQPDHRVFDVGGRECGVGIVWRR